MDNFSDDNHGSTGQHLMALRRRALYATSQAPHDQATLQFIPSELVEYLRKLAGFHAKREKKNARRH